MSLWFCVDLIIKGLHQLVLIISSLSLSLPLCQKKSAFLLFHTYKNVCINRHLQINFVNYCGKSHYPTP